MTPVVAVMSTCRRRSPPPPRVSRTSNTARRANTRGWLAWLASRRCVCSTWCCVRRINTRVPVHRLSTTMPGAPIRISGAVNGNRSSSSQHAPSTRSKHDASCMHRSGHGWMRTVTLPLRTGVANSADNARSSVFTALLLENTTKMRRSASHTPLGTTSYAAPSAAHHNTHARHDGMAQARSNAAKNSKRKNARPMFIVHGRPPTRRPGSSARSAGA